MKKFIRRLFFLLVFSFSLSGHAQCVPEIISAPGIYPDTLRHGCVGEFYTDTITLVFPEDTSISIPLPPYTITVAFDSFIVESVTALPVGISYSCDAPGCKILPVTPGGTPRGCISFSGTPTDTTDITDLITIEVMPYINLLGGPVGTPVVFPMNLKIHGAATSGCATSVNDVAHSGPEIQVFPNPAAGTASVSLVLREGGPVSLYLQDASGRLAGTVFEGNLTAGIHTFRLNSAATLPPGMYFLRSGLLPDLALKAVPFIVIP